MENNFEKEQFVENLFDENQLVNLKEKKRIQDKTTVVNTEINIGSEIKNSTSYPSKKISFLSTDYLKLFFYSKEFVIQWLTKLAFIPTPASIIWSTTIYLLAICSTIERREGGRWLTFLLNVKMPGYNMLYQETSWETFENITSKFITPYSHSDQVVTTNSRSFNPQCSCSHFSHIKSRDVLNRNIRSKINKYPTSFVKYVDLYKDKALIFFNNPLEKQVQKDFVGFYPKKSTLEKIENRLKQNNHDKDHLVLPWYKIGACNRSSRTIIPKLDKKFGFSHLNFSNIKEDKIRGLQYVFPFYKSKKSVYVESDSIPLKLESPYSINLNTNKRNLLAGTSFSEPQTLLEKYQVTQNKELLKALKANKAVFLGNYVTNFQDKLQSLFYLYGFSPPSQIKKQVDQYSTLYNWLENKSKAFLDETLTSNSEYPAHVTNQKLDTKPDLIDLTLQPAHSVSTNMNVSNVIFDTNKDKEGTFKETLDSHIETLINKLCINASNFTETKQSIISSNLQSTLPPNKVSSWVNSSFAKWNLFEKNNAIGTRLMSGYKFPEHTKLETNRIFRKFVLPHLLISSWMNFSSDYLKNQVVLRPFYIKLPPALPFSFFANLASSLCSPASQSRFIASSETKFDEGQQEFACNGLATDNIAINKSDVTNNLKRLRKAQKDLLKEIAKGSHINITYKQLSLQELKEVKDIFVKFGRDYEEYLSLPKDSAPAIRISPSLEDDEILKLEADRKEKKDDEKPTTFEQLQTLRERELKFEEGKMLRPFAYKNQLAFERDSLSELCSDNSSNFFPQTKVNRLWYLQSNLCNTWYPLTEVNKTLFNKCHVDGKNTYTDKENFWINLDLGSQNLLSDRKFSFFGRKNILTKRLVAQEQKEINDQIGKSSYQAPKNISHSNSSETDTHDLSFARSQQGTIKILGKQTHRSKSYIKLQRKARKGLIKLLGSLEFSAHDGRGSQDRTRKPNLALRGKVIKSAYSHLRWQKKRFQSRLLGLPNKRHLIMPEITTSDWKKILEWQLKNYFFLEEQRLQPLIKENPEKNFKIRQLHIYLPWVTIRTPLNKPFQWPLTRLDYTHTSESNTTNMNLVSRKANQVPSKLTKINKTSFSTQKNQDEDTKWGPYGADQKQKPKTSFATNKKLQFFSTDNSYKLPTYSPVYYWDSGKGVSLSNFVSPNVRSSNFVSSSLMTNPKEEKQNQIDNLTLVKPRLDRQPTKNPTSKKNLAAIPRKPVIQTRVLNEPYLCEPLTNQSWLLIYRLFLIFGFKNVLKYIYRISLKDFVIKMANSDFGLMVTSPEMREWLEQVPSKSFYTPRKRLQDDLLSRLASIEDSIPTLSDIIWYLRNYGRGRTGAHGLLLVGPAGAEKTSVVQAIAGECEVPVIVQSMSALAFTFDDPYEQLENVFKQARKHAPCVLFLDDLDAMGQSRAHVITNDIGSDDLLFSLDTYTAEGKLCFANLSHSLHTDYSQSSLNSDVLAQAGKNQRKTASFFNSRWNFNPLVENPVNQPNLEFLPEQESEKIEGRAQSGQNLATLQQNQEFQTRKLNLLLRLLTEMDGISPLNGVVIVATSERPALLDPALVRAGRFERRIYMSLPNKERRIQIFKQETKRIGHIVSMPWDYLSLRTTNMSGADIFSAINHSAIRAILDNTVHTIETLEHGLNCVSGLPNKKKASSALSPNLISMSSGEQKNLDLTGLNLAQSTKIGEKSFQNIDTDISRLSNLSKFGHTSVKSNDPFHRSRLAFYQAGKAVLHNLLLDHPQLGVLNLDELISAINDNSFNTTLSSSRENFKVNVSDLPLKSFNKKPKLNKVGNKSRASRLNSLNVASKSKSTIVSARTRIQFETRLIGLYAGKAAEMLHLSSNNVAHSTQPFATSNPQVDPIRLSFCNGLGTENQSQTLFRGDLTTTPHLDELTFAKSRLRKQNFYENLLGSSISRYVISTNSSTSNFVSTNLSSSNLVSTGVNISSFVSKSLHFQKLLSCSIQHKSGSVCTDRSRIVLSLKNKKYQTSGWLWQSNLGFSELLAASSLIFLMIDRWYLYSQKIFTFKINKLMSSLNHEQIKDETLFPLAKKFSKELEFDRLKPGFWGITLNNTIQNQTEFFQNHSVPQKRNKTHWWEAKVCQALEMGERSYGKWYRIYLPNVEERELNEEWVPPDSILHQSLTLSNISQPNVRPTLGFKTNRSTTWFHNAIALQNKNHTGLKATRTDLRWLHFKQLIQRKKPLIQNQNQFIANKKDTRYLKTLNDFYLFERDLSYQNVVINCFYTAFNLLNENRELLDFFADHLIRFKILRSHEIEKICDLFLSFSHLEHKKNQS